MLSGASTSSTNEKRTTQITIESFPSPIIQKLSPVNSVQPMPDTTEVPLVENTTEVTRPETSQHQRVSFKSQKVRISTPPTTEGTSEDTSEGTEGSEGANRSSSAAAMAELMGPSTAPASPQVLIMRAEEQRCNSPSANGGAPVSPNTRINKLECEKAISSERMAELERENAELKLKLHEATMKDLLQGKSCFKRFFEEVFLWQFFGLGFLFIIGVV